MVNIKYTDSVQFRCLENLRPTSMDLCLIHAGWEHTAPQHIISSSRSEYIIHFILSGKGTFSVNGNTWELTKGQMFLIHPDEPITYTSDYNDPWYYAWIGFNGIRVEQILRNCGFSKTVRVLPAPTPEITLKKIENILDARQLTVSNDLRRTSYLIELFADLIDFHTDHALKKTSSHHDYSTSVYVEHAIEYIQYFYQMGINVSDIVNYVGISRAYLNNSFQKELGVSLQKFLIDFRMHKAAALLLGSNRSISEIAQSVGYEDALTFSKAFKKKFEVSPKLYREQKEKMDKFKEKQI